MLLLWQNTALTVLSLGFQRFILGEDNSVFHYYVAGHENKTIDSKGEHSVTIGTWQNDGLHIGVRVRLFCKYGSPDYEVAVGKFKTAQPHTRTHHRPASAFRPMGELRLLLDTRSPLCAFSICCRSWPMR